MNNTRIVYYTNGTVNRETWNWAADNKRTQTRDAILVKSPKGDYVPYDEIIRDKVTLTSEKINSLWLYSRNIGFKREYTNVTGVPSTPDVKSIFFYFNDPSASSTKTWDATSFSETSKLNDQ